LTAQTPFYGHTVGKVIEEELFCMHGLEKNNQNPSFLLLI